jgi:DNA-binding LacI/PurR family transcriptional regulator
VIAASFHATALQIARAAQRSTGIVALNDLMALGLMAGLREASLRVPQDVSVVGMDGHYLSALSNPMLTTVQLPIPEMAQAMVEMAMSALPDSGNDERELIFTPTHLIERESVAPPADAQRSRAGKAKPARVST